MPVNSYEFKSIIPHIITYYNINLLDTLGSAKGWAANILFNIKLKDQFDHFAFTRKDTFSLGVCNGCQLMALLGWLERKELNCTDETTPQVILDHNNSGRLVSVSTYYEK